MTVRRKTFLIIAITCVGLVIVLYAASRSFLLGGFVKLEQASARENVQRVLNALDQDLGAVDRFTYDRGYAGDASIQLCRLDGRLRTHRGIEKPRHSHESPR